MGEWSGQSPKTRSQNQKENIMLKSNVLDKQTTRLLLLIACAVALAVAFVVFLPQPAQADAVKPPPVPANIQVPADSKLFLVGHAVGTQNYVCLPSDSGVRFVLFTPQATLFDVNSGMQTCLSQNW
jgi:hypothetical protein